MLPTDFQNCILSIQVEILPDKRNISYAFLIASLQLRNKGYHVEHQKEYAHTVIKFNLLKKIHWTKIIFTNFPVFRQSEVEGFWYSLVCYLAVPVIYSGWRCPTGK